MAEPGQNESQEKTEEPTPKKREDAKKRGQAPRSREFNTSVVLLASSIGLLALGDGLVKGMAGIFKAGLTIEREMLFSRDVRLVSEFGGALTEMFKVFSPYILLLLVVALAGPMLVGGWTFSLKAAAPKMSKINPLKGLKRIFSVKGLMELVKALIKVCLIGSAVVFFIWSYSSELLSLGNMQHESAIIRGLEITGWLFLALSAVTLAIAMIDVPFQLWQHTKQLRMSKQEIKDEHKRTEGDPEIKGRIRKTQQEMAMSRMMEEVPQADVIVTNPTHFAVAIKYDPDVMSAPVVIAKGADLIALRIRELGRAHAVPVYEAPPLARALYYSVELKQEIPSGLYFAVAQVLAYVFQLRDVRPGQPAPEKPEDLKVPEAYQDLGKGKGPPRE